MEDCRVVELRHRSQPAEFPANSTNERSRRIRARTPAANSIVVLGWIILSRYTGIQERGDEDSDNEVFNERQTEGERQEHR